MNSKSLLAIAAIENSALAAVTLGLFYLGHSTAGAWALAALIVNTTTVEYKSKVAP